MKKILLALITVAAASLSAAAVTDGQTYAEVNGLKIVNQWIFDRVHCINDYTASPICSQRARTATMDQGIVYVARSEERTSLSATTLWHSRLSTALVPRTAANLRTCR